MENYPDGFAVIGENGDGTITVRMFIADQVIDEVMTIAIKSAEEQIKEVVLKRIAELSI